MGIDAWHITKLMLGRPAALSHGRTRWSLVDSGGRSVVGSTADDVLLRAARTAARTHR